MNSALCVNVKYVLFSSRPVTLLPRQMSASTLRSVLYFPCLCVRAWMGIPHRRMRTIQTFARQRISRSGVRPGCCPFSAHYNWHRTQWLILMTGARILAGGGGAARSHSLECLCFLERFRAPLRRQHQATSKFRQEWPRWIQPSLQMERQQLVKAKSVIKNDRFDLDTKTRRTTERFSVLFTFAVIAPKLKSFPIVP